jgi:hypothetical protein
MLWAKSSARRKGVKMDAAAFRPAMMMTIHAPATRKRRGEACGPFLFIRIASLAGG